MKPVIKGMTALITGASSGMGYEYARQLASMGVHLIAVSNEDEKLHQICTELSEQYAVKTLPVYMDLACTEAASELFEYCKSQQLEVDILINNAGIFFYDEIVEVAPERGKIITLLHMVTPSLLCAYFGKEMKQRKKGYILNMSSISAYMPYPGISYYASTKRYLKTFSRALRSELIDHKVSVSCVCPGAVATNLFDKNKVDYDKALKWGIMMRSEKVVRIALRGLFRKKSVITPGFINHIFVALVRITPQWLILALKRRKFMGL
jgi:uncharacterized protein